MAEGSSKQVDIAITGTVGKEEHTVVVRGISEKVAGSLVKDLKTGKKTGVSIPLRNISKVELVDKDGKPEQTVFGDREVL